ncbi:MAG: response regulator, partial [Gammaproteobacteria bacterium]
MTNRLLIVDDEATIGFALSEYFAGSGWEVDWVGSLTEAKAQVRAKDYTAAIIDLCLSGGEGTEGLEVLDELHHQHPETLCILLTAYGSPWATAEARQRGAALVVDKPVRLAELRLDLHRLVGIGVS